MVGIDQAEADQQLFVQVGFEIGQLPLLDIWEFFEDQGFVVFLMFIQKIE